MEARRSTCRLIAEGTRMSGNYLQVGAVQVDTPGNS